MSKTIHTAFVISHFQSQSGEVKKHQKPVLAAVRCLFWNQGPYPCNPTQKGQLLIQDHLLQIILFM